VTRELRRDAPPGVLLVRQGAYCAAVGVGAVFVSGLLWGTRPVFLMTLGDVLALSGAGVALAGAAQCRRERNGGR
jgi:hypothetical protein